MKLIFVFLTVTIIVLSETRFLAPTYDKTPWMTNLNVAYSSRIINGQSADISQFPYMLALLDSRFGGFICGASIISDFWALSAAHCLEFNTPAHLINFRAGSTSRLSGGTVYVASNYFLHPQYDTLTLAFDVALARTTGPMIGNNIAPITLPPICNRICCSVCEGVSVTTSGWGRNEIGIFPINLMQLTKPVHEFNDCVRIWRSFNVSVKDDVFCKSAFDGKDTCDGDSGSPLITGQGHNRIQVGVVSFGSPRCADDLRPSGNARIEHPAIRLWITTYTGI